MLDKKELNLDDLEKVSGGANNGWYEGDPELIDQLSFDESRKYIGQKLFFTKYTTWVYGVLKKIYDDNANYWVVDVEKTNNSSLLGKTDVWIKEKSTNKCYKSGFFRNSIR